MQICAAICACCVSTELHMQVHLRVDTTLTNNKLDVVAYVARHLTLGDRSTSLAQEFQQVPCEVRTVEVERLGSELVIHHSLSTLLCSQLVRLHATMVQQTRILKLTWIQAYMLYGPYVIRPNGFPAL